MQAPEAQQQRLARRAVPVGTLAAAVAPNEASLAEDLAIELVVE
jgi:hypothetical protein